jgi:uncharacterized membrane protein
MAEPEVLEKRAADEVDLAIGRFVAALVTLTAGVTILALARTQVSFVVGVTTLLAGVGWVFAVRRAAREVRAGVTHTLTLTDEALAISETKSVRIPWPSVTAIEIADDASTVEVVTIAERTAVAPGFGGLGVVPLYEKLGARWRASRGDAQP